VATKAFSFLGIKRLKPEADKLLLSMAKSVTSLVLDRDDTIYSSWLAFLSSDFCLDFLKTIILF